MSKKLVPWTPSSYRSPGKLPTDNVSLSGSWSRRASSLTASASDKKGHRGSVHKGRQAQSEAPSRKPGPEILFIHTDFPLAQHNRIQNLAGCLQSCNRSWISQLTHQFKSNRFILWSWAGFSHPLIAQIWLKELIYVCLSSRSRKTTPSTSASLLLVLLPDFRILSMISAVLQLVSYNKYTSKEVWKKESGEIKVSWLPEKGRTSRDRVKQDVWEVTHFFL